MQIIETTRLRLVPATVEHVHAEINDRGAFAHLIPAEIPTNWPPESTVDALPLFLRWLEAAPQDVGWFGWYALAKDVGGQGPVLVGSGGFLGPPQNGMVDVGYSVLPQYHRRGIATEMVAALLRWAYDESADLDRIAAETEWSNPASVRVLSKLGFVQSGQSANADGQRFELSREKWSAPG
jgi:[ribosomal protein S5]-alanine N-acetyltransferase